jgi:hypothetical protein
MADAITRAAANNALRVKNALFGVLRRVLRALVLISLLQQTNRSRRCSAETKRTNVAGVDVVKN